MADPQVLLASLNFGRCSDAVEVRLLRFWEARNVRRGEELMSVDMLFVDADATLVQGSIGANRQLRFRERLIKGSLYTFSGFDVTRNITNFRLSDAPMSVRFNEGTSLEKMTESVRPIPMELFRFMPYSRLLELANTGKQLPDVRGELSAIRSTITDRIPGAQRAMLTLRLESGENVCVSMFDSKALEFHAKFDSYGKEPRVIVATSVNPKIVGGNFLQNLLPFSSMDCHTLLCVLLRLCFTPIVLPWRLFLNATSATHLYFDSESTAGRQVFENLPGHGSDSGASSSKIVHAQKIEPLSVSELNQFIATAESQIIEFLCTAKVNSIEQDDGWCYIGCSVCSKKLVKEISSFTCLSCDVTNAVAALRYRVKLSVSDGTDTACFLGFDVEMAKLTNVHASDAAQIVGIDADARVDTDLPRCLADIVGKTFTFQLKLIDFNFSPKHQTFTISHIFPQRALAPLPAFAVADGPKISEETVPEAVPAGTIVGVGEPRTASIAPSTSDGMAGKRPAPAKGQVGIDDTATKKPYVE